MNYSIDHPAQHHMDLDTIVDSYGSFDTLTLAQQFEVISVCPNIHSWASKKNSGVKMHQYFCPNGVSPRNLILDTIELTRNSEDHLKFLTEVIQLILNRSYQIERTPKVAKKKVIVLSKNSQSKEFNLIELLCYILFKNDHEIYLIYIKHIYKKCLS